MTRRFAFLIATLTFASVMFAQQAPAVGTRATPSNTDTKQFETVLTHYQAAYERQDIAELLAVWPTLPKDDKQFKKIKRQLERADISSVKLVVEPHDVQFTGQDDAVVQCATNEEYVQIEKSDYYQGDAQIQRMGTQNTNSLGQMQKKTVKKNGNVWMTLHRDGDKWTIVAVSDKKPH